MKDQVLKNDVLGLTLQTNHDILIKLLKTIVKYLLDAGWHTNFPRFQGARLDFEQV